SSVSSKMMSPPVARPPRYPKRSTKITSAPLRAAATAADTPADPPPITNTWVSALTGVERGSSSMKRRALAIVNRKHSAVSLMRRELEKRGTGETERREIPRFPDSPFPRFLLPLPHLLEQPQQRLFRSLLPVPHGALLDHRMGHGWEFVLLGANVTQPPGDAERVDKRLHRTGSFSSHILGFPSVRLDTQGLRDEHLAV